MEEQKTSIIFSSGLTVVIGNLYACPLLRGSFFSLSTMSAETKTEPEAEKVKQFTLDEVAKHTTVEDCWLIIGNSTNGGPKVYDVTKYLDDHPGGAEVMLDVSGQDADEFFEDIGHSKEARNELAKHLIGDLFMDEETKAKLAAAQESKAGQGRSPAATFFILAIAVMAVIAGMFLNQKE